MATAPSSAPTIAVCLRISDLRPEVDPLSGSVHTDRWGIGLSGADAAALESALRLRDHRGGRIVALTVAGPLADDVLREVWAHDVDVLRIDPPEATEGTPHELGGDERALADQLLHALGTLGHVDLVLCGDRSHDRGTGALPAYVAHELDCTQATGLVELDTEPVGTDALHGVRRLEGGWRERLRIPLPAVCSLEGAGVRLRRASLAGALAVEGRPVPVHVTPVPSVSGSPCHVGAPVPLRPPARHRPAPSSSEARLRLLELTGALVAHEPPTVVGPVDASTAVDEFLSFLARHGYRDADG